MICYYCKEKFEYSLKGDILPVCGKNDCREKYNKDHQKAFELLANIGGRTTRGML